MTLRRLNSIILRQLAGLFSLAFLFGCSITPTKLPIPPQPTRMYQEGASPAPDRTATRAFYQKTLNANQTQNAIYAATQNANATRDFIAQATKIASRRTEFALTPSSTPAPTSTPTPEIPFRTYYSPNGDWIVQEYDMNCSRWEVIRIDQAVTWEVYAYDKEIYYSPEGICTAGRDKSLLPVYWSDDGQYFYYADFLQIDGNFLHLSGSGLQRLRLSDGLVEEILPENDQDETWYDFTIQGNYLVYNRLSSTVKLGIRNLSTGKEHVIELKDYSEAGRFLWSPDKSKVIFTAITRILNDNNEYEIISSILQLNIKTLSIKVLIKDFDDLLSPVAWENDKAILLQRTTDDYQELTYSLDLATGELLTLPTITPTP